MDSVRLVASSSRSAFEGYGARLGAYCETILANSGWFTACPLVADSLYDSAGYESGEGRYSTPIRVRVQLDLIPGHQFGSADTRAVSLAWPVEFDDLLERGPVGVSHRVLQDAGCEGDAFGVRAGVPLGRIGSLFSCEAVDRGFERGP
jgi:hypothetical protein